MKTGRALLVVLIALPLAAQQAAPPRPEVLVLGVYHMANPGHDLFNTQADDVLAPKRQAEIAQVVAALEKFHPTKIALETDANGSRQKQYAEYVAGTHELSRNEIEQLGFRLAKQLGHKTVFGVDVDGEFQYLRLVNFAKAKGRSAEIDAMMNAIGDVVKSQNAFLASHSILDTLLLMNSDEHVAQDVGFYYRQGAIGEPWDWAGADFLTEWIRRNLRIYSNVMQLVESPNDRILVIYGAGHLGWLRQAFGGNPNVRLRKLAEFAP